MCLLNILLLLIASLACASSDMTWEDKEHKNSELLVYNDVSLFETSQVTFNTDKNYDLIIDKVVVKYYSGTIVPKLVSGGHKNKYVTLKLVPIGSLPMVGVYIYGRMNKGTKDEINYNDIKFTKTDP